MDALFILLGMAIAAVMLTLADRERRAATDTERATLRAALEFERQRTRDLASMLDAAVADRLQVAPPAAVSVGPATAPLPPEIIEELDALDSDLARAEYELLIRQYLTAHPDAEPHAVLAAVMP